MLLHVAAIDIQNVVTGDDIALLVHAQAAVSVTIESKADIQTVFHHELLQALDMGRTSIIVDVQPVRLVVDNVGVSTQSVKHTLSDIPACTVGAVQTDLHALEGVDAQADQVAHVAVTTCHIVHGAADVLPVCKGQLRPVLVKYMEFAVDVVLHQQQGLLGHLLTVAIDQLDTVIIVRVVAGRDHDAAIKVVHAGNISYRRRSSDVQQVSVCSGGGQSCDQTVLEHIGAAAGVFADYNACRLVVAIALAEHIVIPAQKATNLVGMVGSQINTSFTTEAIGPKILSHSCLPRSQK